MFCRPWQPWRKRHGTCSSLVAGATPRREAVSLTQESRVLIALILLPCCAGKGQTGALPQQDVGGLHFAKYDIGLTHDSETRDDTGGSAGWPDLSGPGAGDAVASGDGPSWSDAEVSLDAGLTPDDAAEPDSATAGHDGNIGSDAADASPPLRVSVEDGAIRLLGATRCTEGNARNLSQFAGSGWREWTRLADTAEWTLAEQGYRGDVTAFAGTRVWQLAWRDRCGTRVRYATLWIDCTPGGCIAIKPPAQTTAAVDDPTKASARLIASIAAEGIWLAGGSSCTLGMTQEAKHTGPKTDWSPWRRVAQDPDWERNNGPWFYDLKSFRGADKRIHLIWFDPCTLAATGTWIHCTATGCRNTTPS